MSKRRKTPERRMEGGVGSVGTPRESGAWFFLLPFVRYFSPHKFRLLVAFAAMLVVGVTGSTSILLLKPPLDILFGLSAKSQAQDALEDALEESRAEFSAALDERRAAGHPPDSLHVAIERLQTALERREAETEEKTSEGTSLKDRLAFAPGLGEWAEAKLEPHKARVEEWGRAGSQWIKDHPLGALWLFAGILIGLTVIKCGADYLSHYLLAYALNRAALHIKEDIFRHVIHLDYAFFIRRTTGFLENRISSDVGRIRDIFNALISDSIQQPITLVCLLAVLLIISPPLTIIALVSIAVGFWPLVYFARQIRKVTKKSKAKEDELSSVMDESLRNFRIVKVFGTEDHEVRKFRALNDRLFRLIMARRLARFGISPIMEIIGALGVGAVLILGGILVLGTPTRPPILEPVSFLIYLVTLSRFYGPMKKLSRLNINWQIARISAMRIQEMLALISAIREDPEARRAERFEKAIEFKNVSFTYGENPVLVDINLTIPKGKVIALVGRSGSGKSTLANMLPRLLDPVTGCIEVDGVDMRHLDLRDLRRLFGVVTQDTVLFNDTVEANIAYGTDEVDQKRLVAAATAAHAHEFILQLEGGKGYKTVIGQAGQQLSGGQRQRLAIARALYRDPEILIFDEATSSLDAASERYVQQAIDNLLRGRTALIIAHRLSTIQRADEILVLRDGRIIERGTHEELLDRGGEYWSLYHLAAELDGAGRQGDAEPAPSPSLRANPA